MFNLVNPAEFWCCWPNYDNVYTQVNSQWFSYEKERVKHPHLLESQLVQ
jgi:hypothetical protein